MNQSFDSSLSADRIARFYLLDILRGFASLSVIIWHYKNLYAGSAVDVPSFPWNTQPFYIILWPFYEYGDLAVYLFFILSGFVFFHVYEDLIVSRKVTFRKFFVNRFSRLYPLHFLTLLVVACLQAYRHSLFGNYLIYRCNDFYHFLLNLPLASAWGFQKAQSFNGPIWSVSVEMFLYLVFFLICRYFSCRIVSLIMYVIAGFVVTIGFNYYLGIGLFAFFSGGLVFRYHGFLVSRRHARWVPGFLLMQFVVASGIFYFLSDVVNKRDLALLSCITFSPALILLLAYLQAKGRELGRSLILIGDLTYSTYLLHFPIQIIMNILYLQFGMFPPGHNSTFVIFLSFTYIVSFFTYRYFELELKNWLRTFLGD